ncbi:related to nuclear pore protein [Cephalotrichum gorgonifer]|uniref:Related to nuclear pore protein n=1 Tax=Cephalotrichum gorgonifer TaxID=2041049 RepID=A0AAE8N5I1_9PEZI|nr:related to nuclear pore protein [Cephalotrichum gorgonifer]
MSSLTFDLTLTIITSPGQPLNSKLDFATNYMTDFASTAAASSSIELPHSLLSAPEINTLLPSDPSPSLSPYTTLAMPRLLPPEIHPTADDPNSFDLNLQHGHRDLVQAVAFNTYGDRCATGSVDGKIRVFNRHKDGMWRICDTWSAHGGEILELQWLPATIYPNLLASLGLEGRFKLWAEDPSAPPGRRFASPTRTKAAFDTRSSKGAPYRSFSMKHVEPTHHTYLALLDAHGRLTIYESDEPESIAECVAVDELTVCSRPSRGEEVSFRVRFDPNPEVCYTAVRAGVAPDSLALVVAAMDTVKIYRSRDVAAPPTTLGAAPSASKREFYPAAEISGHRGLVRDVAWSPGNIRGYDTIATACQDGFVRVFRLDAPFDPRDGRSWAAGDIAPPQQQQHANGSGASANASSNSHGHSGLAASFARPDGASAAGALSDRNYPGVRHVVRELCRLDSHRTPVWRVGFDDDGAILGSVGDDGRLVCFRQMPSGLWAKSSELGMVKARMVAP